MKKTNEETLESVDQEEVLTGFLNTALGSTLDCHLPESDKNDPNLDENYSIEDIGEDFVNESKEVIRKFLTKSICLFTEEELEDPSQIGHDLWLTIAGHGAGFWDGDYKNGDAITKICKEFPEMEDSLRESISYKDETDT